MDKYTDLKTANLIVVDKIKEVNGEKELHLVRKQFDINTGEEIAPWVDVSYQSNLLVTKAELEQKLADVNELLEEFEVKK